MVRDKLNPLRWRALAVLGVAQFMLILDVTVVAIALPEIGAALLSPAALTIVTTTFHGRERSKALGVWGALGGSGAAVGVLLGGLLTAGAGWEWVFFLNVPTGVVLVAAAAAAAIFGLINAGDYGWGDQATLLPLAASIVLYAVFLRIERAVSSPLMHPRVLARRPVLAAAFLMLVATGLLVASFFLGSFYLQHVREFSPLITGLLFLPVAISTVIGAHTASSAVGRAGYRPVAAVGLTAAAVGTAVPAIWMSALPLVVGISVAAAGLGATFGAGAAIVGALVALVLVPAGKPPAGTRAHAH